MLASAGRAGDRVIHVGLQIGEVLDGRTTASVAPTAPMGT